MLQPGCDRQLVYAHHGSLLYHYLPVKQTNTAPILIIYALVNTPKILDLHPNRSFIRQLLEQNNDVYLLEWGDPSASKSLADYILEDIHLAVNTVANLSQQSVHLMGVCQAGYFSLCYAALFPEKIASLIPMVTPVDFEVKHNRIFQLLRYIDLKQFFDTFDQTVPGWLVNHFLRQIAPFDNLVKKCRAMSREAPLENEIFIALESWAAECPAQSPLALLEFTQECVQNNALVKGEFLLQNNAIVLANIQLPILNIYATQDHFWPTATVQALATYYRGRCYQEYAFGGGHVGVFVSQKGLREIPEVINDWITKGV
ncbi:MAG: alpha/beta fold hydrolase [Candidatus Berkiellales bacterium]